MSVEPGVVMIIEDNQQLLRTLSRALSRPVGGGYRAQDHRLRDGSGRARARAVAAAVRDHRRHSPR
jgi:hypothetical protein